MKKKINNNVYWVGKVDWELQKFHVDEYSTHKCSTYNAYLIKEEKSILVDTVWLPFYSMRKLLLIISLIFHLVTVSCISKTTDKSDESLTAYYIVEIPEKMTDGPYNKHQTIIIDTSKKIHKLDFGVCSTESTIEIFREENEDEPLIKQHLEPNNRQIVDITGLNKGIYRIRFTAIAQSCVFFLEIK